jgi:hypothetical protein
LICQVKTNVIRDSLSTPASCDVISSDDAILESVILNDWLIQDRRIKPPIGAMRSCIMTPKLCILNATGALVIIQIHTEDGESITFYDGRALCTRPINYKKMITYCCLVGIFLYWLELIVRSFQKFQNNSIIIILTILFTPLTFGSLPFIRYMISNPSHQDVRVSQFSSVITMIRVSGVNIPFMLYNVMGLIHVNFEWLDFVNVVSTIVLILYDLIKYSKVCWITVKEVIGFID